MHEYYEHTGKVRAITSRPVVLSSLGEEKPCAPVRDRSDMDDVERFISEMCLSRQGDELLCLF
jgi:hypothetical protein